MPGLTPAHTSGGPRAGKTRKMRRQKADSRIGYQLIAIGLFFLDLRQVHFIRQYAAPFVVDCPVPMCNKYRSNS